MKKQIRVLHVTGKMNKGGAEVMLMEMMRHKSDDIKFDFLVNLSSTCSQEESLFEKEIRTLGGKVDYIPSQNSSGYITYYKNFKNYLRVNGKPDIVHIHLNAKCGYISLVSKICGVKAVISHIHANLNFGWSSPYRIAQSIELKLQNILINTFSDQYWGCSNEANESVFYRYNSRSINCKVINNAIDLDLYLNKEKHINDDSSIVIGNVGRIVENKNLDYLFEILNILYKKGFNFKFIFAGRIDDRGLFDRCINYAKENDFYENVLYIGEVDDVPKIMLDMDVFVAPSENEGFGMVAIEAQAASNVCILSQGFPNSVDVGLGTVHFLQLSSKKEWAESIITHARKKKLLDKLVIKEKFKSKGYDIKDNISKVECYYVDIYNNLGVKK
ncbi:glycosyltransferase [Vibrio sp. Isolate30]|uniref:glycosyltransferase n=1 Tax=Vibrio sp. Isolate30 TaxID=2908536 RepID=UPI001EFE861F|nr:glycosyltransferase [Vibrio sp. Isolate30]MCG9632640.1 glycosyltransferase [Vibrio sp. Isolate30]